MATHAALVSERAPEAYRRLTNCHDPNMLHATARHPFTGHDPESACAQGTSHLWDLVGYLDDFIPNSYAQVPYHCASLRRILAHFCVGASLLQQVLLVARADTCGAGAATAEASSVSRKSKATT